MDAKITLLPGDGIGPEIVGAARQVLDALAAKRGHQFAYDEQLIGGAAIDAHGDALPDATVESCMGADAVLLGAVGGPKWDDPNAKVRPERGLLGLRKSLGVFANLRPTRVHPALASASPLKEERLAGIDLLMVRELTGGLYFGTPKSRELVDGQMRAVDTLVYTEEEIRRVVTLAFEIAKGRKKKVTSVDKANVLESSRLWRTVATEVGKAYPEMTLEHQLVDSCAMRLVTDAASFDVIVTENMFGDILSDEAAVLTGSLGVLPSASLGTSTRGLYEPIHGSAPDIAGQSAANPTGTILSAAMMLRHSFSLDEDAKVIEAACDQAISDGKRTRDLGGDLTTDAMTDAIIERLA